jgi:predicted ATPase
MKFPPAEAKDEIMDYSSVKLFLEAARRIKPGYMPDNLEDVAYICRLVEGMPLSLLLASSWVSDYPATEIAEQINSSLDFLSVEWADLPERRSFRATFEYSWELLDVNEREALMSRAVIRNPFNIQVASEVANASSKVLHALVGKSLLGQTTEGNYQMHDLVRHYSADKLVQAGIERECAVRQRRSDYFDQVAEWSGVVKAVQASTG